MNPIINSATATREHLRITWSNEETLYFILPKRDIDKADNGKIWFQEKLKEYDSPRNQK